MMKCPVCSADTGASSRPLASRDRFLCACGALLPPDREQDHFSRLGVDRSVRLDADVLEQRYKELSRQLHPDKFVRADAFSRRHSLEHATFLNDAYRTLRDPLRRAGYLLSLAGHKIDENAAKSPALLMEMMELGETLAEAKNDEPARRALFQEVQTRRDHALERLMEELDAGRHEVALATLVELRYLDRFLEGQDKHETAVQAQERSHG